MGTQVFSRRVVIALLQDIQERYTTPSTTHGDILVVEEKAKAAANTDLANHSCLTDKCKSMFVFELDNHTSICVGCGKPRE